MVVQHNDARRTIGEFLLSDKNNIHQYSMDRIAKETFTSKASLTRFAKLLGYSGWKEFMYAFSHEVVQQNDSAFKDVDPNFPFASSDKTIQILEHLSSLQIQSIQDSLNLVVIEDLEKAAKLISQSKTVTIFGTSPNNYYAELLKRKLLAIGLFAIVAPSGEIGTTATALSDKDCAIVISYSGNNPEREPTSIIKYLLRKQVPIIGVTSGGKNYLRDYSTVVLNISSKERLYSKITNFTTEQSIMFILNALYAVVFSLNYDENIERKISLSRDLEPQRQATFKELSE